MFFNHFAKTLDGVPSSFEQIVEGDRARMSNSLLPAAVSTRSAALAPSPSDTKRLLKGQTLVRLEKMVSGVKFCGSMQELSAI